MSIAIVIVNYRTAAYVERCLRSLEGEISRAPQTHVVVVDNDSLDGSLDRLRDLIAGYNWAHFLPMPRNGGFSYGNNAGISYVLQAHPQTDQIWLLNPDTIVH